MNSTEIHIDGRMGEGGGQVVRTSLSLAAALGRTVVIDNIRGGRKKPGLKKQHRTALRAVRDITGGEIEGDELGSPSLRFSPGEKVYGGSYRFAVGSAGSTMLVLQTVLPPLLLADKPSMVILEGGTHNPMAPPFDCLVESFFPCLREMGASVTAELVRPGFFPAGGGEVHLHIEPALKPKGFRLLERGAKGRSHCTIMLQNLPVNVAELEWKAFHRKVHWTSDRLSVSEIKRGNGPGNVMLARLAYANVTAMFVSFGAKNLGSELVGKELARLVKGYEASDAPVDEFLSDQLMLPMALLGGGSYRTTKITKHTATNAEVINLFLPGAVDMSASDSGRISVDSDVFKDDGHRL